MTHSFNNKHYVVVQYKLWRFICFDFFFNTQINYFFKAFYDRLYFQSGILRIKRAINVS
jgi:hypothetical protein